MRTRIGKWSIRASMAGMMLGLCALSSDASALTRRVCAVAGIVEDDDASFTRGNCSILNNDAVQRWVKYSLPLDSTANLAAKVKLQGGFWEEEISCARLRTFQNGSTYSYTSYQCVESETMGVPVTEEVSLGALAVPASGYAATLSVEVGAGMLVWDVQFSQ